jgi:hypothetical protein
MEMITRHTAFSLALALIAPLLLAGCFPDIPDSGAATPLESSIPTGGTTGTGQITGGGTSDGTGGDAADETPTGNEGTDPGGDAGTDGDEDVDTDGDLEPPGDVPTNGDGEDPTEGTPLVVLSVSDTNPGVNEVIFLTCVATDSGSSLITEFDFFSSIGGGEIVHDLPGNPTASVVVPPGLVFINYQCRGINAAGPGPLSEIVRVDVAE